MTQRAQPYLLPGPLNVFWVTSLEKGTSFAKMFSHPHTQTLFPDPAWLPHQGTRHVKRPQYIKVLLDSYVSFTIKKSKFLHLF